MARLRALVVLLFVVSCTSPGGSDAGVTDGGRDGGGADAGDAGAIDASDVGIDAPSDDAGADSGASDTGTDAGMATAASRPVVYQLVVRLFGNTNETRMVDGTLAQNGAGHFSDVNDAALSSLRAMGVTHVYLTGVIRQATLTDWSSVDPQLGADDPDIVKGRAGSFFAVRDYYDVSPDLADDPAHRMDEFDALVARIHAHGMQTVIDLVPNHVSRAYHSIVHPEWDFGVGDDQSTFFSSANSYYYVTGGPLRLSHPASWAPAGVVFDGLFAREDGSAGHAARATGNNAATLTPSATDWYETVKLDYGLDFTTGTGRYTPMPTTWTLVDHVLAFWQSHGVNGFRCDFAHYVPDEAWTWILAQAHARDPHAFLFAEAYERLPTLLADGFDAVYFSTAYDALKNLYLGRGGQTEIDGNHASVGDPDRNRYVVYLENHDERRLASPIVTTGGAGDSGFGSPSAAHQLAPLQYLWSGGPILLLNGQELGEPGAGVEGFGGDDGRTTIFDYWSMPTVTAWSNGHAYDGGRLTPEQAALRAWYADLFALAEDPAIASNRYWGLEYFDNTAMFGDCPDALYTFARFETGGGRLVVVVVNFAPGHATTGRIRIPTDLASAAGLPATRVLTVRRVFGPEGAASETVGPLAGSDVATTGFPVTVGDQAANVYVIE